MLKNWARNFHLRFIVDLIALKYTSRFVIENNESEFKLSHIKYKRRMEISLKFDREYFVM